MHSNFLKLYSIFALLVLGNCAYIKSLDALAPNQPLRLPETLDSIGNRVLSPSEYTKNRLIPSGIQAYSLIGQLVNTPNKGIEEPYPELIKSPQIKIASKAEVDFLTTVTGITTSELDNKCEGWCCESCLKYKPNCVLVKKFNTFITDNTGFIIRCDDEKAFYLNFRGTRSELNLIQMFSLDLIDYPGVPGARVHRGYYQTMLDGKKVILGALKNMVANYPDYDLLFIAHSFGAPVAHLSALEALKENIIASNKTNVISLGSPRVGNYALAKYALDSGASFLRVVNRKDTVPHYPNLIDGYVHVGVEVWDRPDNTYICDYDLEVLFCSDTLEGHALSFNDHTAYFGIKYSVKTEFL